MYISVVQCDFRELETVIVLGQTSCDSATSIALRNYPECELAERYVCRSTLTSSNFNRFCARSFLAGSPSTVYFFQPAAFSSFSLPFLAKYAMRVPHQNREAKMDNRVIRRYQCVEKLPSVTVVNRRYFARNFPDRDFLPITRGAFYQRLSMVNSIKIRRTEMTASVRVRTTRQTDWWSVDGQAWYN